MSKWTRVKTSSGVAIRPTMSSAQISSSQKSVNIPATRGSAKSAHSATKSSPVRRRLSRGTPSARRARCAGRVPELRLAQVELVLDPAPRVVLQRALTHERVEVLPLRVDQAPLQVLGELGEAHLLIADTDPVVELAQPLDVVRAHGRDDLRGQLPSGLELLDAAQPRLDGETPARDLFRRLDAALLPPLHLESEPADHPRQGQALTDQGHDDHGEGEEQDQIAVRERIARRGRERDRERGRERHDSAYAREADEERRLPGRRRVAARERGREPARQIGHREDPHEARRHHDRADERRRADQRPPAGHRCARAACAPAIPSAGTPCPRPRYVNRPQKNTPWSRVAALISIGPCQLV